VRIHITFLLLPAYFGFVEWRAAGPGAAAQSVFFILLLFCCVLLHEFGHAFAGRRYGIRTPDITLLPIGGVARMMAIPDKPTQEFVIAVAGPAVNVAIGVALVAIVVLCIRNDCYTYLVSDFFVVDKEINCFATLVNISYTLS
jgi:Zn-dependent protease